MRWQLSLQLAVGMGALFGLAYYGVDRFIGPPLAASSVDAADAYAIVGASEIATSWERTRSGRRALVRALAGSPTFREGSSDLVEAALESAAVQMGGGSAVLMQAKEKVASFGEAPDASKLKTAADAQRGVAMVRFERIDGALYAISAAPVPQSDDRVLVLASKIEETDLRQWIRGLPDDVSVVLLDGDQVIASTVVPQLKKSIVPPFQEEIVAQNARFRTARRTLADDVGNTLEVVGLSAVRSVAGSAVLERVQLLILSVGGLALILALVLVMIAPSESVRELIEEFNSASRDLPRMPEQPLAPVELSHEPALETPPPFFSTPPPSAPPRGRDWMPDSPPLSPPAPSFSNPAMDLSTQPVVKRDRPASDTRLALDAEQKMGRPVAKPPPPVPPSPSRSNPFGVPDPIPLPGHGPSARSNASVPPASPFDQIAAAAFAPPSAPPPSSVPRLGPKEDDLLMPKGVDLDSIAREAAKQGPPKYEPTDLPGLRSPFSSSPGLSQVPPSSVSSGGFMAQPPPSRTQRSEDLPGLRANDPAARAFDRPSSNPPAGPAGQPRKSSDPWSNPALGVYSTTPPVQERLAVPNRVPSNPPAKQNTIPPGSAPIAYDEEHYRVVYNDFVSSKARLGEAVDNITYEGFRSKLRSSEEALINRHGCRAVRFQVLVKDNTVSLRPQLVR